LWFGGVIVTFNIYNDLSVYLLSESTEWPESHGSNQTKIISVWKRILTSFSVQTH